jgi:hypothetical protein
MIKQENQELSAVALRDASGAFVNYHTVFLPSI